MVGWARGRPCTRLGTTGWIPTFRGAPIPIVLVSVACGRLREPLRGSEKLAVVVRGPMYVAEAVNAGANSEDSG